MRRIFLAVLLTSSLYANPEGMKVVSGSAALTNSQKELTIETGERAILTWEKFSIAKDELTRFNMPSSSSSVLNRVTSREMSQILGKLESNGRVYLLNPNGVIIGKDACINAASFIASTYDVLDSEFLKNGDLSFSGNSNEKIVNLGTIKAFDGDAILIGRYVQNDGSIEAEKGVAALGAGKEILLKPLDKERIYIRPNIESQKEEGNAGIENNGEIKAVSSYLKADGNLYSLAIKNSGKIDALAFEEKGGEIFLIAENSTVETSGELKAVKESKGGEVRLLGKNVGLLEKAIIDVSHENDGGTVLIGGDYQGKNKDVYNAKAIFIEKDTFIDASSLKEGNAGKVILWSDDCTKFYGNILAEGGKNKGNGGFVEVSGKKYLEFGGDVSTQAVNGSVGLLFLDPGFITITPTPPSNPSFPQPPGPNNSYAPPYTGSDVSLFTGDLQTALASNNVTVSTQGDSQWSGIFILNGSQVTWNTPNILTLQTTNFQQDILMVSVGTDTFFYAQGGGQIVINSTTFSISIGSGNAYLRTDNGKIKITAQNVVDRDGNVTLVGGNTGGFSEIIATGSGTIDITADQRIDLVAEDLLNTDAQIRSENGDIHITTTNTSDLFGVLIVGKAAENHSGHNVSAGIYTTGTGSVIINSHNFEIAGSSTAITNTGIYTFGTGSVNIVGNAADSIISVESGIGQAAISSGNTLSITGDGIVNVLGNGSADAFISSLNTLNMSSVNSLTMRAVNGNTYIKTTGANQNIKINDSSAKGADGFLLNDVPTAFASYISTDNGGNIECYFSGSSVIGANAAANTFGGLFTGRLSGGGNITFSSGDLAITGGGDVTSVAGLFAGNAAAGSISFNVGSLSATANAGRAGIFSSTTAASNITGLASGISLTSGTAAASISAPAGSLALSQCGPVLLTANGPSSCSIESNTSLQMDLATSITMVPTSGNTFISSGISGGSGPVNINASAAGSGGIILNQAGASHASYISSDNSGDVTCKFLGNSSFRAGAAANAFSGIFSGRLSVGGNINFSSGDLTITGGGDATSTAGLFGNHSISNINFNVGQLTVNAGVALAGIFSSPAISSNITGSATGITLISNGIGVAAISATGTISLSQCGNIILTANGSEDSFITSSSDMSLLLVNSITMSAAVAETSISSVNGGNIVINSPNSPGSGGINLSGNASSSIATYLGGNIECYFSGNSSFNGGSNVNAFSGIITGLFGGGGDLTLRCGDLSLNGGSGVGSFAAVKANGSGFVFFPSVGNIDLRAGNVQTGAYASIETAASGTILINFLSPKGHLNMTAAAPANSYAIVRAGVGGEVVGYFSTPSSFQAGSGLGSVAGVYTSTNDIFLSLNDLTMTGGSGNSSISAIETTTSGNIDIISNGNLILQGGSSASCQALIQTGAGGGEIDISGSSLLKLQGGFAATASAYIQTLGAGPNPINITVGEVLLNSSLTVATSEVAIRTTDPTSFVTVIANGSSNALGDISLIANAAPAFISNAININAAHDLILESVNNDAYILTTSSSPFFIPLIVVGNELIMDGSPNTVNVAKITPIGAATTVNITVQDDAFLTGNIGSSFISGYSNINMFTGDSLTLASGLLGSAFIDSTANASFQVGSLNITAALADARITAPGNLNINVFDNNMTLTSIVNANAFIQGGNTSIDVKSNLLMSSFASGTAFIQSVDYSLFNVGLDISLSGTDTHILKTGSSPLIMTAGSSVLLNNGSYFQNDAGTFTVFAGENIVVNGSRIENITSDDLTLVADNNFPVFPEIGHGHFEIGPGSTIKTASGGKLRLFSVAQEFNTIESSLNGEVFVAGPLFDDSSHEVWGVYYPDSFFGGPGFTVFYKNTTDISHFLLSAVDFAASELFFRLNNMMIDDLYILDYLEKFIYRSKYFFVDNKREELAKRERSLIKLIRD